MLCPDLTFLYWGLRSATLLDYKAEFVLFGCRAVSVKIKGEHFDPSKYALENIFCWCCGHMFLLMPDQDQSVTSIRALCEMVWLGLVFVCVWAGALVVFLKNFGQEHRGFECWGWLDVVVIVWNGQRPGDAIFLSNNGVFPYYSSARAEVGALLCLAMYIHIVRNSPGLNNL